MLIAIAIPCGILIVIPLVPVFMIRVVVGPIARVLAVLIMVAILSIQCVGDNRERTCQHGSQEQSFHG
jgi:hypothetical protein